MLRGLTKERSADKPGLGNSGSGGLAVDDSQGRMGQMISIAQEREVSLGSSGSHSCQRLGLNAVLVCPDNGGWNGWFWVGGRVGIQAGGMGEAMGGEEHVKDP